MGRPRGKSKKLNESDEDGISGGEEASSPTPTPSKRRGRPPQKPVKDDDTDDAEDKGTGEVEVEEDADGGGVKPVVQPGNKDGGDPMGTTTETGGKKRRRRVKRSADDLVEEDEEGHVKSKPHNGFRPTGSRRKSTPRRAAEAGVECK